jgi:hypothetical protein
MKLLFMGFVLLFSGLSLAQDSQAPAPTPENGTVRDLEAGKDCGPENCHGMDWQSAGINETVSPEGTKSNPNPGQQ